jgi:5-oxopent-3-ene-1,2,5-tricarboxylate decarboxylase/2-hydroxyhepta-2,4-diene-1,7-dioate isomerase
MGGDWAFRGKRAAGGQGAQFYESKVDEEQH